MSKTDLKKDNHKTEKKGFFKKFSGQFWLVVFFEFIERGSYYGMMSFISVYFTEILNIPKENVGIIKWVIQPLLYFLPIISGAVADRFGYRRVLMVAFALMGGGYFLTSQANQYTTVFVALVVMGFGAGIFKPLISATIARITDESSSTIGFGIYYWSINLGAFLFPLILVPFLKSINPTYVIISAAVCTAAMIIPTAFFYREPTGHEKEEKSGEFNLLQTLANAFEIIYSPVVLIYLQLKKPGFRKILIGLILAALTVYSVIGYLQRPPASEKFATVGIEIGHSTFLVKIDRNMQAKSDFELKTIEEPFPAVQLTIFKPHRLENFYAELFNRLNALPGLETVEKSLIENQMALSDKKVELIFQLQPETEKEDYRIEQVSKMQARIYLKSKNFQAYRDSLLKSIHRNPLMRGIKAKDLDHLAESVSNRSFFLLFVISLILIGLFIVTVSANRTSPAEQKAGGKFHPVKMARFLVPAIILVIWFLPGLSTLGRIISSVIYLSLMSLFIMDRDEPSKFFDHAKFLLMIFLYSGFWILYFQMFDSVLWYVQAYVDATSLNSVINKFLGVLGIHINWFFDVEHVTVINAGTIIILQLIISNIVKKRKALPTMITGIGIGTAGMAILAISTNIWVFICGIVLFSIGEMTAHPKFISYIGLVAPTRNKAMYMGYLFLYGVFGSSIGGIVGARLYVTFVDNLNQPRVLWLIFSGIGVMTIICLMLYNKFLAPKKISTSRAVS
jgi:dipeptide/tripeptide permease